MAAGLWRMSYRDPTRSALRVSQRRATAEEWAHRFAEARPWLERYPVGGDPDLIEMTPRTAYILNAELSVLADDTYTEIEAIGDAPIETPNDGFSVLCGLPRITWRQGIEFRRMLARAADDLAKDIERGGPVIPRCTGEEVMLGLAIDRCASGYLEMLAIGALPACAALPRYAHDYDWSDLHDLLFQDSDYRMLYHESLDGIDDPDDEYNKQMGIGDMRVGHWFDPFLNVEPRDPGRGFRR